MKASTTDYVHLQNLYKNKANTDLSAFVDCVKATLSSVELDDDAIDDEEVVNFVKNCHTLQCIDGRSLRQEYETDIRKEMISKQYILQNQVGFRSNILRCDARRRGVQRNTYELLPCIQSLRTIPQSKQTMAYIRR